MVWYGRNWPGQEKLPWSSWFAVCRGTAVTPATLDAAYTACNAYTTNRSCTTVPTSYRTNTSTLPVSSAATLPMPTVPPVTVERVPSPTLPRLAAWSLSVAYRRPSAVGPTITTIHHHTEKLLKSRGWAFKPENLASLNFNDFSGNREWRKENLKPINQVTLRAL